MLFRSNDTATTEIYTRRHTLSLHDALPISVVIELPNGVFITTIPAAVAAGMSILSTPIPARPMTLRFLAAAMTSLSALVAERTARCSRWRCKRTARF